MTVIIVISFNPNSSEGERAKEVEQLLGVVAVARDAQHAAVAARVDKLGAQQRFLRRRGRRGVRLLHRALYFISGADCEKKNETNYSV